MGVRCYNCGVGEVLQLWGWGGVTTVAVGRCYNWGWGGVTIVGWKVYGGATTVKVERCYNCRGGVETYYNCGSGEELQLCG